MSALGHLPSALRRYVVDQRYETYSETDHDVWRRVIGTISRQLDRSAHPSYARGFVATGMSRDRIPRIEEMDESLSSLGWHAVAVDGFIPPRAFQAFQAVRILPIARDVRRPDHLEYTPAPDILHEAAGHAPMLVDPEYAAFAERIGAMGMRAFSLPSDRESFEAIRELSILKEDRAAKREDVEAAEARVATAMRPDAPLSEAGKLARFYWWTIEYGLVGAPSDFRLYGAGLLSSLGESVSCHDPSVLKIPLTAECVEVPYDITRPQPQLFVVSSFAALDSILDEVMEHTAFRRGGLDSLDIAIASEEVATLRFAEGARIDARVTAVARDREGAIVTLAGPATVVLDLRSDALVLGAEDETLTLRLEEDGSTIELSSGPVLPLPTAIGGIVSCHPTPEVAMA